MFYLTTHTHTHTHTQHPGGGGGGGVQTTELRLRTESILENWSIVTWWRHKRETSLMAFLLDCDKYLFPFSVFLLLWMLDLGFGLGVGVGGGGRLVGVFCTLFCPFFLFVCAGDGLGESTRMPYLWRRRGSWGVRPSCLGLTEGPDRPWEVS